MSSIEDVTKILSSMDEETYRTAVKYIFFLADTKDRGLKKRMDNQRKFLEESAGKIFVDEVAVDKLRVESMI